MLKLCLCVILLLHGAGSCQSIEDASKHLSLPEALLVVANKYHVPVVAELSNDFPFGLAQSVREEPLKEHMDHLTAQCPGYVWSMRNGVLLFSQQSLLVSKRNPMNIRLAEYHVPANLSLFKLTFPQHVEAAKDHESFKGGLITGIGLPPELSPPLRPLTLRGLKARDILTRVAADANTFFSVIVLPEVADPQAPEDDFLSWDLAGGTGLKDYRTHLLPKLKN